MLDEIKQECIERMKILKLDEQIIKDFIEHNKIFATVINCNLITVTDYKIVTELIKLFELKKQGKIYHIISIEEEFRTRVYILYVSKNKDNWKNEKTDLKNGFAEVATFEETRIYDNRNIGIEVTEGKISRVV